MAQSAKGVIVAFESQQGFGRVAVDEVGEMTFDSVVAVPKPSELVAGVRVSLELGPSRIPGKLKVLKLWLEGTSGEPTPL